MTGTFKGIIVGFALLGLTGCSGQPPTQTVPQLKQDYPIGMHIPVASDHQKPNAKVIEAARRCAGMVKSPSPIEKIVDWNEDDESVTPPGIFVRVKLHDKRDVQCTVPVKGDINFDPDLDVVDCAKQPNNRACHD